MSSTTEIKVGLLHQDGTTTNYTLPANESITAAAIRTRVNEINSGENAGATYLPAMRQTFVSADGASMLKIGSVKLTTVTEEVIYSG